MKASLTVEYRRLEQTWENFQRRLRSNSRNANDVIPHHHHDVYAAPSSSSPRYPIDTLPECSNSPARTLEALLFHQASVQEVEVAFNTSVRMGLNPEDVPRILALSGKNEIPRLTTGALVSRLFRPLWTQFCPILWVAVVLCFVCLGVGSTASRHTVFVLLGTLLLVIVVQAIPEWIQQTRIYGHLLALERAVSVNLTGTHVTVIRGGGELTLSPQDLVVGDLVKLEARLHVPADMRVVEVNGLRCDTSHITGETTLVTPTVEATDVNPLVSANMIYTGTVVTEGVGYAIVTATGRNTQTARIVLRCMSSPTRNVQMELVKFINGLMVVAIIATGVMVCVAVLLRNYGWTPQYEAWEQEMLNLALNMVTAFIPEGLPIALAGTFHILARKLEQRGHVVVGTSSTIETLGRVSVVCTDKTGTLTYNALSVAAVYFRGNAYVVPNDQDADWHSGFSAAASSTTSEFATPPSVARSSVSEQIGAAIPLSEDIDTIQLLALCDLVARQGDSSLDYALRNLIECFVFKASSHHSTRLSCSATPRPLGTSAVRGYHHTQHNQHHHQITDHATLRRMNAKYTFESSEEFSPTRKHSSVSFVDETEGITKAVILGAPEVVLTRCDKMYVGGDAGHRDLTEDDIQNLKDWQLHASEEGNRVIAIAYRITLSSSGSKISTVDIPPAMNNNQNTFASSSFGALLSPRTMMSDADGPLNARPSAGPTVCASPTACSGYVLMALLCLRDPIRPKVSSAVRTLRQAGIKVFMISGDNQATCVATARRVGIVNDAHVHGSDYIIRSSGLSSGSTSLGLNVNEDIDANTQISAPPSGLGYYSAYNNNNHSNKGAMCLVGSTLDTLSESQWTDVLRRDELVFARTTPEQKLMVVEKLRQLGHVVAVLGDGLNDAPALKLANVGVAMRDGSQVAHDAADIIVDHFPGIVKCITFGRIAAENLRKVIAYLMPAGLVTPVLSTVFHYVAGFPLGVESVVDVFICMVTDLVASLAVLVESPAEDDIMERHPRRTSTDSLVSWSLLFQGVVIGVVEWSAATYLMAYSLQSDGYTTHELWNFRIAQQYSRENPDIERSRAVFLLAVVWGQLGNLVSTTTRTRSLFSSLLDERWSRKKRVRQLMRIIIACVVNVGLMLLILNVAPIAAWLHVRKVGAEYWALSVLLCGAIVVLSELMKILMRRCNWCAGAGENSAGSTLSTSGVQGNSRTSHYLPSSTATAYFSSTCGTPVATNNFNSSYSFSNTSTPLHVPPRSAPSTITRTPHIK
eukprot:PhM_4_TR18836/c0_g1_i1/m.36823/K01539/ATP1A; sodium/potassium-transporting ATPase subunit alpha